MILVGAIVPVLLVCLVLMYGGLLRRFFKAKGKIPPLGLRSGLGRLTEKRRRLAVLGVLFFLLCLGGQVGTEVYSPDMLMSFNYEEAARGQNPNVTRFNESDILSDRILEKVIQRGGLEISVDRLADFLTISTPLDAEALDVTQESSLKISTEYRIHCSERAALYHTNPKRVLALLADVYWEDFVLNYAENDRVLDLTFESLEGMEYLDVKNYLEMQANKLRNYIPQYSSETSSFRAAESGETFASLTEKISNFIDIELERYQAFTLENGLSIDGITYQSRMQYTNRMLDTSRKKEMASHDVRIEAINMYNAHMTRFVLIPTYDADREFYMSKTKVGVDYFADEAKEYLESATELLEEMEHNTYASEQVGSSRGSYDACAQADQRIEELKAELMDLSVQCRELCGAYVREKRDGYIQVCLTSPGPTGAAVKALVLTALFLVAQGGIFLLDPYCRKGPGGGAGRWKSKRKADRGDHREAVS